MLNNLKTANGWVTTIIVLVLGGFVGFYVNLFFVSTKSLVFSTRSVNYISDSYTKIRGFSAFFDKKPIANLTKTSLIILNNGNTTIEGSDITKISPLQIKTDSVKTKILKISVIYSSKRENNLILKDSPNNEITFDYLDKNHGGILEILHTGTKDENIIFDGTIKGMDSIKYIKFNKRIESTNISNIIWSLIMFLGMLLTYKRDKMRDNRNIFLSNVFFGFIFLFILFVAALSFPIAQNFFSSLSGNLLPLGFEAFFQ